MAYKSLRDFIEQLEAQGELARVSEPVSTVLEMTEIQTRLLRNGGPAVLFENVVRPDGSRYEMPVLINLFGTVERVAWGMDREPNQLRGVGETLAFLRQPEPPGGFREALELIPLARTVLSMKPKTVCSPTRRRRAPNSRGRKPMRRSSGTGMAEENEGAVRLMAEISGYEIRGCARHVAL